MRVTDTHPVIRSRWRESSQSVSPIRKNEWPRPATRIGSPYDLPRAKSSNYSLPPGPAKVQDSVGSGAVPSMQPVITYNLQPVGRDGLSSCRSEGPMQHAGCASAPSSCRCPFGRLKAGPSSPKKCGPKCGPRMTELAREAMLATTQDSVPAGNSELGRALLTKSGDVRFPSVFRTRVSLALTQITA